MKGAQDDNELQMLIDKEIDKIAGTAGTSLSRAGIRNVVNTVVDSIHGMSLCVGKGLVVYGEHEAIHRTQGYILLDTTHPIEKEDVKKQFARALQAVEKAQGASVGTKFERKAG
jgi:hypothetical protein